MFKKKQEAHRRALYFDERVGAGLTQRFKVNRWLYKDVTPFQKISIFENDTMGRVMVLDGYVQTTTADEYMYHEMLAHVPLFGHGKAKRILIIGGGDGGTLRRCLEHTDVEHVTMVEIDRRVVEAAKKWMPEISAGAFEDPRCLLIIGDGLSFVKKTEEKFDVILVDSTDPVGAATRLFTQEFYKDCRNCLASGGVLAPQSGMPFFQKDEARNTHVYLKNLFKDAWFFTTCVPSYYGGHIIFGWATDNVDLRCQTEREIGERLKKTKIKTGYYNAQIHVSSFVLPQFMAKIIKN
ncbi:MAG: polyamine aminopropyltransferase [Alphaproteobacteria bacterium]|nr:polyamine aminopropyltransferase [Alphaproteobacteria bacterium]